MPNSIRLAAAPAVLAALSLAATPASAAELALPAQAPAYSDIVPILDIEDAQTADHHRRYRHHRYRRGPGLGDVLAGVLIVGAIAHVANKASRNDREYRERDYRRDVRYDESRGIDRAVNMCLEAVDRERRVETVDRVDRTARGWRVEGTITRGDPFTCQISERGRVNVDFGPREVRYEADDREDYDDRYEDSDYDQDDASFEARRGSDEKQLDDDRYAAEWSKVDREQVETRPAYPGGPVDDSGQVDADLAIGTGYKGAGN